MRGRGRTRAGAIALLVAAGGLGGAVTPAGAASLAYVKAGVVWVSAPDGSDAHEVGPGLTSPALTDDGTVMALAGADQVDVLPPGAPARSPITIYGVDPTALSVSPDGGELAWGDTQEGLEDQQDGVSILRLSDGRRTDRLGDAWPRWFGDTQLTMGGPNGGELFDAASDAVSIVWPESYTPPNDVAIREYALDRAGTLGAAIVDYGSADVSPDPDAHSLVVFPAADDAPATSAGDFCVLDDSYPQPIDVSDASWSPDGTTLAWQEDDGIHEATVPTPLTSCGQIAAPHLAIPTATDPAWGPSDDRRFPEPAAPHPPTPTPTPAPTPTPGPTPSPSHTTHRLTRLTLRHRLTSSAFLRHGLRLHVRCPETGTLTATAAVTRASARRHRLPSTTVAITRTRVRHAGTVALTLHATRRDHRRLTRAHHLALRIALRIHRLHTATRVTLR